MAQNIIISSSKDIRDFTEKLTAATSVAEIAEFLKVLGMKLKSTNRHNKSPDLLGDIEELILKLQGIFAEKNLRPKTEDLLFDIVGEIQRLTLQEEDGQFTKDFFAGIPKLGVQVQTFAGYLGALIPVVTTTAVLLN